MGALHALKQSAQEADVLLRAWTFSGTMRTGIVQVLRVREAWTAALEAMPPDMGGMEGLRRQWIAAVLAFGVEAAEGWLSLLAILPAAAPTSSHCGLFCLFRRGIVRGLNLTCRCKCTSGKRMDRANAANQPFGA